MEDRADPVVARWSDPVKPLRSAWKQRARQYRADASHIGSEGILIAWHDRLVVPYFAGPGQDDIAAILDRSGDVLQTITTPRPHTRQRSPIGPVITWPDETLVAGLETDHRYSVMWIDPDGASQIIETDIQDHLPGLDRRFLVTPAADGDVFISVPSAVASFEGLGWTLDLRLDSIYGQTRRAPFEHHEYISQRIGRGGIGWEMPGRVMCVADDIAICEQGSGLARSIVARRVSDGGELWRCSAVDAFVLGTIPLPAWSDDRVYVIERGDRRREAWARETETANLHGISPDAAMRTMLSIRAAARARVEQPVESPSHLRCLSTKTGDVLWETPLTGDLVSFYCHATWVAAVVAGTTGFLQIWRHDGTSLARVAVDGAQATDSWWPPDAARWPCIAHGDSEHVIVAQHRAKPDGGPRLYEAPLTAPDQPRWEVSLPVPAIHMPLFRWLRLLNRVPMAFTADGAFLRWGKQLYGYLP